MSSASAYFAHLRVTTCKPSCEESRKAALYPVDKSSLAVPQKLGNLLFLQFQSIMERFTNYRPHQSVSLGGNIKNDGLHFVIVHYAVRQN